MRVESNYKSVGETEEFKKFSDEFHYNIEFLESFSDLIIYSGRIISFFTNSNSYFINTALLDSSVQTLKSVKLCCSIGSFTDANTLIRKFRDDLLLFVYILEVTNRCKPFLSLDTDSILTNDEKAVEAW